MKNVIIKIAKQVYIKKDEQNEYLLELFNLALSEFSAQFSYSESVVTWEKEKVKNPEHIKKIESALDKFANDKLTKVFANKLPFKYGELNKISFDQINVNVVNIDSSNDSINELLVEFISENLYVLDSLDNKILVTKATGTEISLEKEITDVLLIHLNEDIQIRSYKTLSSH